MLHDFFNYSETVCESDANLTVADVLTEIIVIVWALNAGKPT
jgi:hypothetical protein